MMTYDSLLQNAIQLSPVERLQLIEAIWESVPQESMPPLSQEWLDEIERRSNEYDAGNSTAIPWETVRDEAFARSKKRRNQQ